MATKIYDLATKIFLLIASWLLNEYVNFEPCGCGWNFKLSGWNFGIELHQLSLPYIIILKSFVVNFLDKKFCRFFVKLLSRFFRRLLFNYYYFFFFKNNVFGCKFRAALATTIRRPLRIAVIPARDGNAELIMKKSSCLLYVRLQISTTTPS